jgi:hypothetical protein
MPVTSSAPIALRYSVSIRPSAHAKLIQQNVLTVTSESLSAAIRSFALNPDLRDASSVFAFSLDSGEGRTSEGARRHAAPRGRLRCGSDRLPCAAPEAETAVRDPAKARVPVPRSRRSASGHAANGDRTAQLRSPPIRTRWSQRATEAPIRSQSNDTPEGRLRNRRIEYHILKTPLAAATSGPSRLKQPQSQVRICPSADAARLCGSAFVREQLLFAELPSSSPS